MATGSWMWLRYFICYSAARCSPIRVVMWSCFFFSSRRRHTRCSRDWSSDVCSSDLYLASAESIDPKRDRLVESHLSKIRARMSSGSLGISANRGNAGGPLAGGGRRRRRSEESRGGEEGRSPGAPDN